LVDLCDEEAQQRRLERSVIRPLRDLGVSAQDAALPRRLSTPARSLVRLAKGLTGERVKPAAPANLIEATAAVQELACQVDAAAIVSFERLQAKLPATVTVAPDGPYLVTNLPALMDWLGVAVPVRPHSRSAAAAGRS
jgi:hypothetical protein